MAFSATITDRQEQFKREMEAAGYTVRAYEGRNFYRGPAVVCDDLQDAIRATKLELLWDHMGKSDLVVYPK